MKLENKLFIIVLIWECS